jgi:replicative DNA helicase
MINVQAVVLKILLSCTDKELALACFDKIEPHFFSSSYGTIHKAIMQYYEQHHRIPGMVELSIKFSRNTNIQVALATLQNMEDLDVDLDMAVEALRDEYAQQETLNLINRLILDDMHSLSAGDLIDRCSILPLKLEEKVSSSGSILTSSEIPLFDKEGEEDMELVYTGISNDWDSKYGGVGRQELVLLGGKTGSGKSLVCCNFAVAQWKMGNIAPYYSVEMSGRESLMRMMSIMAGVDALKVKQKSLEGDELLKLALTRAKMFHGGHEAYKNFVRNKSIIKFSDFYDLDQTLMNEHEEIHPLIIVDDSDLRMSSIDVSVSKFKSQYGKKLTMALVDYLNVVRLDSQGDAYDWVYQLQVAEALKKLARKHDIGVVSPYQTNEDGSARFSKAILVPVDAAFKLEADQEAGLIGFNTQKVRSMPPAYFNVGMNWKTLAIDPEPVSVEEASSNTAESQRQKVVEEKGESSFDV